MNARDAARLAVFFSHTYGAGVCVTPVLLTGGQADGYVLDCHLLGSPFHVYVGTFAKSACADAYSDLLKHQWPEIPE